MLCLLGKCSCINQKPFFPSLRHSLGSTTLLETAVVLFCTFNPVASCSGSCLCQTGLFLHELSVCVAKYASMRHTVQMANNSCLQPGRKSICHCFIISPHCVAFRQTHSSRQVPKRWCLGLCSIPGNLFINASPASVVSSIALYFCYKDVQKDYPRPATCLQVMFSFEP